MTPEWSSTFVPAAQHGVVLGSLVVRVLAYTAGMVVILWVAAALIKSKNLVSSFGSPKNAGPEPKASNHWATALWQRHRFFGQLPADGTQPADAPIINTLQTLSLAPATTAHVLSQNGQTPHWLLVTSPSGSQLHSLLAGSESSGRARVERPALLPDGWGQASVQNFHTKDLRVMQ